MSLFEEVNELLDSEQDKLARDHLTELSQLKMENYNFYEVNEQMFTNTHSHLYKHLEKIEKKLKVNEENFQNLKKAFEYGNIIHHKDRFRYLKLDQFCKGQGDLPDWFEPYKCDQLEKARDYINNFCLRSYRNRINETTVATRKRLEKKIIKLIEEIRSSYKIENRFDPPILKIQELQHLIEEIQEYDRIIAELAIVIMRKVDEVCEIIVKNFITFKQKCDNLFK